MVARRDIDNKLLAVLSIRPMTRGELSKLLNVPRTTIYDHLVELMFQGKVIRLKKNNKKRGRPKVYFKAIIPEEL